MKFKTSNHIYAHIDCDSFFASCEILRNPKLYGKYVCVGTEIIIAATYNAKALGVKVGTPIWEAKKILRGKDAYFLWHNMDFYREVSQKLMSYLRAHVLDVREFSIDEAFVDISWLSELKGMDLDDYVLHLQHDILQTIGIPVSIGVSNTRLKAKIFSKVRKPFGIYIWIDAEREADMFQKLSFREIPFIGSKTAKKLDFYITSIQDYLHLGYFEITRKFWKNGWKIWLELRGVSSMWFTPKLQAKSIGRARSFNTDMTSDPRILLDKIASNLDRIFVTLSQKQYEIWNISLLLVHKNWENKTIDYDFKQYTHDRRLVFQRLEQMFDEIYIPGELYRKTWVFSSAIRSFNIKQLSLFYRENMDFSKNVHLEKLMQDFKQKYWKDLVRIGE